MLVLELGVENKFFVFLFFLFELCMTLNFTPSCTQFICLTTGFESVKTLSSQEF